MSMEITKRQINLATIYRPLNNFFLNPFMEYVRRKYVCKNQIKKGRGGEYQITDAIKILIKEKSKFVGHKFKGKYLDCGTMHGFIKSSLEISKS